MAPALFSPFDSTGAPQAEHRHTAEVFFTDDSGTYIFETRDGAPPVERDADGGVELERLLASHKSQIRKLSDKRIHIPNREPYMEGHNTWVGNAPGSLLIFPVGDLAQHALLNIAFYAQNGFTIYDDINKRRIPGIEEFRDIVDVDNPYPLSFLDQYSLAELSAELAIGPFRPATAASARSWRLDLRRHRPADYSRRERRSGRPWTRLPLR